MHVSNFPFPHEDGGRSILQNLIIISSGTMDYDQNSSIVQHTAQSLQRRRYQVPYNFNSSKIIMSLRMIILVEWAEARRECRRDGLHSASSDTKYSTYIRIT